MPTVTRHSPQAVLPLWAAAAWLNDRGYRESYRTLRRRLEGPCCPIRLRAWSPGRQHRVYPAIAERDLARLQELLGPPPRAPRQATLPL
jgi:hypothetical protein